MIGQQHQVLVKTDDPNAIAPVWRTKLGSSRKLVLGVYVDGALATVSAGPPFPYLRIRRPEGPPDEAVHLALDLVADSEEYNLQLAWEDEDLEELGPGRFIADVMCTIVTGEGEDVEQHDIVAPDSQYIVIEILAGAGA